MAAQARRARTDHCCRALPPLRCCLDRAFPIPVPPLARQCDARPRAPSDPVLPAGASLAPVVLRSVPRALVRGTGQAVPGAGAATGTTRPPVRG
ncbi:hypothetical protein GCM10010488_04410 [Oerskovia jenensis]